MPPSGSDGVICFAGQDWWYHVRAHSDTQLMLQLARSRPVLLVNSIGMRMPTGGNSTQPWRRIGRKLASMTRGLRAPVPELPRFHVFTPIMAPVYAAPRVREANARAIAWQVRAAARLTGIRRPDLVVTLPTAAEVIRHIPHRTLVYNRSDRHSAFPGGDVAALRGLEDELFRTADAVAYVSHRLLEEERGAVTGRAVFLDHGVDLDHFSLGPLPEPADLAGVPRPRVGFIGAVDDHLVDLGLLARVADGLPDAHLVLVGPSTVPLDDLARRPNVHVLGARPYADVPAYGLALDVALMPWLDNDWIRHSNPVKMKEYLALGLPVVSTDFPEVHRYADVIDIAGRGEDYVATVRRLLDPAARPDRARQRSAVRDDTWQQRGADLAALFQPAG